MWNKDFEELKAFAEWATLPTTDWKCDIAIVRVTTTLKTIDARTMSKIWRTSDKHFSAYNLAPRGAIYPRMCGTSKSNPKFWEELKRAYVDWLPWDDEQYARFKQEQQPEGCNESCVSYADGEYACSICSRNSAIINKMCAESTWRLATDQFKRRQGNG